MRGTGKELSFFAEDQFYRNLVKSEFAADGIHQVALIRKVNAFGVWDKEDKSRGLNAGLCRVGDAHGPVLIAGHRIFPDGSLHQVV